MATIHLDKVLMPTGRPVFNAAKVSDAIALLCPVGESFDVCHLLVMLYVVDRRVADYGGGTLTEDQYFSQEGVGPIPRGVATILLKRISGAWLSVPISRSSSTRIKVLATRTTGALSEAELEILEQVREEYAHLGSASMRRKVTEEAPEWIAHIGHEFTFEDLLIALGEDTRCAQQAFKEWESRRQLKHNRDHAA